MVQILLLDLAVLLEALHCIKSRTKWGCSDTCHESVPPDEGLFNFLLWQVCGHAVHSLCRRAVHSLCGHPSSTQWETCCAGISLNETLGDFGQQVLMVRGLREH